AWALVAMSPSDGCLSIRGQGAPQNCPAANWRAPGKRESSADKTISTEGRNAAVRDPRGSPTEFSTKKLTGTEVPAKFEQGGFTSGRRKGPQTLFPGTSPGNRAGGRSPPKL